MSTKSGVVGRHRFHGDPKRFEELAYYIAQNYSGKVSTRFASRSDNSLALARGSLPFATQNVKRIADVAGGQGMLCRFL